MQLLVALALALGPSLATLTPATFDADACAALLTRVELAPKRGADAVTAFDAALHDLPPEAVAVAARARTLIGDEGDFTAAFAALQVALAESCGGEARAAVARDPERSPAAR